MLPLQWQSAVSHITTLNLHSKLRFAVPAQFIVEENLYLKGKKQQN